MGYNQLYLFPTESNWIVFGLFVPVFCKVLFSSIGCFLNIYRGHFLESPGLNLSDTKYSQLVVQFS